MQAKRRSYAQREFRRELDRFLHANRRLLIQVVLVAVAVCAVPLILGSPGYTTGVVHALMLTSTVAIVSFAFLFAGGGALLLAGSYGESYSQEQIEKAVKKGRVWGAVHNIEIGPMDIDHLVITPAGVLALETKWRFRGATGQWLDGALAQAEASARKARSVLRSKDVGHLTEVRPVLVVWGGGRRELPASQRRCGVDVVRGDALVEWLRQFDRGPVAEDHAEALHQRLTSFAVSHHAGAARRQAGARVA